MELFFLLVLMLIMATALGSGYPVAFALPGSAIITFILAGVSGYLFAGDVDAYFHSGGPSEWVSAGVLNLRGVYWEVERDTLIAIPLFIFMGIMLQRSKIAEDLLVTMAQLFGPVPGGLGISVVFVGALLAATTGIVGATVVAMGMISLPAMLRNNYSPSLATGTIAASGTLGQIIPPSIVLIILADQLASATDQAGKMRGNLFKEATGELQMPSVFDVGSTSAGEMFLGALIPGLVLVGIYMIYILGFALLRPSAAPAVPYDGKFDRTFWSKVFLTLVPPLALIFLVLGSIIGGIATVNQAGSIGAAGALVMAGYRLVDRNRFTYYPAYFALIGLVLIAYALNTYEMNIKAASTSEDFYGLTIGAIGTTFTLIGLIWSALRVRKIDNTLDGVMLETAKTTALVFVILLGAAMLTAAFRAFGGEELVREFLISLPGGFWAQFIIVMLVIFILGFFLDFIEIAVVVVPIVAPILLADPGANITAVWLGVMIGLNIQTSFLTPPFGFALFYLRGVAPKSVKTIQMYKGVVPFITLQLIALAIVGMYPPLVNYLPNRMSFLSDTAPPPRNPKLQFCLDDYSLAKLNEGTATQNAIEAAKALDISILPKDLVKAFQGSVKNADAAVAALQSIPVAHKAVTDAEADYRPILTEVRGIEKQIRNIEEHRTALEKDLRRNNDFSAAEKTAKEAELEEMVAQINALTAQIPSEWDERHEAFKALSDAESKARQTYQRAADQSVEGAVEVAEALAGTESFKALEAELMALRSIIETEDFEVAEDAANETMKKFREIGGADSVKDPLNKAKRALRKKKQDREKALKEYEKAVAAYAEQLVWRAEAEGSVKAGVMAYLDGIKGTIGVRMQPKLDREQALYLASCTSNHRDLSLNF